MEKGPRCAVPSIGRRGEQGLARVLRVSGIPFFVSLRLLVLFIKTSRPLLSP